MLKQYYRSPNCFRTRLHIAAQHVCPSCSYNLMCPFGFNVNMRPAVNEFRIDFDGRDFCNLDCRLCWAKTWISPSRAFSSIEIKKMLKLCLNKLYYSMHELLSLGKIRKPEFFAFSDFQITGGEPLINKARAIHLVSLIKEFDALLVQNPRLLSLFKLRKTGDFAGRARARLFTNGISVGRGDFDELLFKQLKKLQKVHIDLLVSLKGTNQQEFTGLQSPGFNKNNGSHKDQVRALEKFKKLEGLLGKHILSVYLVFGMYHSKNYDVLCNNSRTKPSFSEWSNELKSVVLDYFQDSSTIIVEPVKNPYAGRDEKKYVLWEQDMKLLLRSDGKFEPLLKKGRGRSIETTIIANKTFRTIIGGKNE